MHWKRAEVGRVWSETKALIRSDDEVQRFAMVYGNKGGYAECNGCEKVELVRSKRSRVM